MDFHQGLAEHLTALSARDIDRFAATISRDPEARVVGPDGSAILGAEAILDAHRGWFASASHWSFEPRIVLARESSDLGFALLDVSYREDGDARRFLLSLVFTREDGSWRLFYDQNTTIGNPSLEVVR